MTAKNRREIETKTVDANVFRKVGETVNNKLPHAWMVNVDGIATSGVVYIDRGVARFNTVVGEIVDAPEET
ncbi:MAG: hypothetical protein HQ492_07945 [Woeseiaceae bacterium]|nr:hypothetical protein [Woeseiaceae bacterium]